MAHHLQVPWLRQIAAFLRRRRARRGRILAVRLGYNPNSSSLGVDVTFLLFGMAAIALLTPVVSLWLRAHKRKARADSYDQEIAAR
jgi:hypothetical protein